MPGPAVPGTVCGWLPGPALKPEEGWGFGPLGPGSGSGSAVSFPGGCGTVS